MVGRSSKGCQKLHWELLCAHHLGDCWPCVLCGCEIFLVCLGVPLFCGIQVFAWFLYGTKRVCVFMEVLGKVGCVAVAFESLFVFFIACVETPSSLVHVCFVAFWHVSLYMPERVYLSGGGSFIKSNLSKVLLVRNAILISVCLNIFVIYVVSLPV